MTRPRHVPKELVDQALSNLGRTSIILAGISPYDHLSPLEGPSFDLDMMNDLFLENESVSLYKSSQVTELDNPTSDQFRKAIVDYAQGRSARGDILILYFTGHGCVVGANSFGFCLKDTGLSPEGNGVLPLTVVALEDVVQTLALYDVHPVFIIDACFSSMTAPQGHSLVPDSMQSVLQRANPESFGLLASCNFLSTSMDTPEGGPFTRALHSIAMDGLTGEAGKHSPFITLGQLDSPLREKLSIEGFPLPRCYVGHDLRDIPIAKNTTFYPQTVPFTPYLKKIVEFIWNNGFPRDVKLSELIAAVGRGAYGNHSGVTKVS